MAHNKIINYENFYMKNMGKDQSTIEQLKKEFENLRKISDKLKQSTKERTNPFNKQNKKLKVIRI